MQTSSHLRDPNYDKHTQVDKTLFIKDFIKDEAEVLAILRPSRFCKSTNLLMLKSFLSFGQESRNFTNNLISNETLLVQEYCGMHPVVFLELKECKGNNWFEMYQQFWTCLLNCLKPHSIDLNPKNDK